MEKAQRQHLAGIGKWSLALWIALAGLSLAGCNATDTAPEGDPAAEIVIQHPKGGETFVVGDSLRVMWKTQGKGLEEVDAVNIEISPDSGKTWLTLLTRSIGTQAENWGNFSWQIPATMEKLAVTFTLTGNTKCLLKIMQYGTSETSKIATTKSTFAITSP